jgi:hypothetical protein
MKQSDYNDGVELLEPILSDNWNPDGSVFPIVCHSTKEVRDAVDKIGITLNKEVPQPSTLPRFPLTM